MAYTPKLTDIPNYQKYLKPKEGGYKPSIADLPPKWQQYAKNFRNKSEINSNSSFLKQLGEAAIGIPLDVASGAAKGTYDLLNMIPGFNKLPGMAQEPESLSKAVGLPQNAIDRFIGSIASFAPSAALGEAALPAKLIEGAASMPNVVNAAKLAGTGALSAQSQGQNPIVGGALAAIGPESIVGIQKLISPFGKTIANKAIPEVLSKIVKSNISPNDVLDNAIDSIKSNYATHKANYDQLENEAQKAASLLDESAKKQSNLFNKSLAYNNNSYKDYVSRETSPISIGGLSTDGERQVTNWKNNLPNSFKDAVSLRKNINKINVPYGDPSAYVLQKQAGNIRNALIQNAEENAMKHADRGDPNAVNFINKWRDANQYYKDNVAPFESLFTQVGMLKPNKKLAGAFKSDSSASSDILKEYIKGGALNKELNNQHLSNLIGDPELASQTLKNLYFKNDLKPTGEVKPSFIKKYADLSSNQRNLMFSPNSQIAIKRIMDSVAPNKSKPFAGEYLGPAVIGGKVANKLGADWDTGAISALLGKHFLDSIIGKPASGESGRAIEFLSNLSNPTKTIKPLVGKNMALSPAILYGLGQNLMGSG